MRAGCLYAPGVTAIRGRARRLRARPGYDGVPCWLIFDDGYRRRYALTARSRPGRPLPQEWIDKGTMKRADTIEELG